MAKLSANQLDINDPMLLIVITGAGISKSGAYDKVVLLPMLVGTLYSNFG
jgi:hypothetical protein